MLLFLQYIQHRRDVVRVRRGTPHHYSPPPDLQQCQSRSGRPQWHTAVCWQFSGRYILLYFFSVSLSLSISLSPWKNGKTKLKIKREDKARWVEQYWDDHLQVFDGNVCFMVFILASRSFIFWFAFRCCIQEYAACGRLELW